MGQIGQPIRRYIVIPLEEPVAPTAEPVMPPPPSRAPNNPAPVTKPEPQPGLRVGEIIAYRAWQVINPRWSRNGHERLHSVFIQDYVWHPDEPASGDVRTHGIYSFRRVIRSMAEYGYDPCADGLLLFGKVKIWGEVVEHELGYCSQFGKIVSLDYGNPRLLEKFRKIYRVNQVLPENYPLEDGRRLIW